MANYLAFLNWIIKIGGTKLPRILAFLQAQMDLLTEYSDIITPAAIEHNAAAVTGEEEACEAQIAGLLPVEHSAGEHGKIGDGTFLRQAWAFLQANPWILQLLLK